MFRMPHTPICPHCGDLAPHGDERLVWNSAHLDSWIHRVWWKLRKVFRR